MTDIENTRVGRTMQALPPKEPLTSLSAIRRDFEWRFAGELANMRDPIIDACAKSPTWQIALAVACASIKPDGKMHNHQSRVPKAVKEKYQRALSNEISGLALSRWRQVKTFNDLFTVFDEVGMATQGVGEVYIYDACVRFAAFRKLEPDGLYLHAGARQGWDHLQKSLGYAKSPNSVTYVPRTLWPIEVQDMKADDFEDMICGYKQFISKLGARV